jgi:hypothetical protein
VEKMKKSLWMTYSVLLVITMTGTLLISDVHVLAADQDRVQQQVQTEEQIYGSQLMTEQERAEYRARMRNATTAEERERIRNEHHERMKVRAEEQGYSLPDQPRERGMGWGTGSGGGMGPGGGKGQGGRNR